MTTMWRAGDFARAAEREESLLATVAAAGLQYEYPREASRVLVDHDLYHSVPVGALRVSRFCITRCQGLRSPRLVRRYAPEEMTAYVRLSGQVRLDQFTRQTAIGTDAFALVDLSQPYRVDMNDAHAVAITFPRASLPLRDKDVSGIVGTTFDRNRPGAALITSAVREMVNDLDTYAGPIGAQVGASLLDLFAATIAVGSGRTRAVGPGARRRVLMARIRAFIEENLSDPNLGPPMIAARHYISVRQLHNLFENEHTTVGGLIRSRRLARCRNDLLDPAQEGTPVSAIGARWGYADAAHFSRLFRAAYGVPPSVYSALSTSGHHSARRNGRR